MAAIVLAAVAAATVLLGAIPRILLAADALPGWLRPLVWSDILHIWERGVRDGVLPYRDAFFEYPPLAGAAWTAIDAVAETAVMHVTLWAILQAACAGIVGALLASRVGARRALMFWSASPQLLLYGSVNVETLALAPLVAALVLAQSGRAVASGVALALGTAAKLFPAAVLPVLFAGARDARTRWRSLMAFATFSAAAFAPVAAAPFSGIAPLARYSVGIEPNLDSPWGLLRGVVRAIAGADPRDAVVAIALVGMIVTYVVAVLPATRRARDIHIPAGVAVLTVTIWSPLYSPQYALWSLPFFALARIRPGLYALMTLADVAVFSTVYPLTLVRWSPGDAVQTLLFAALTAAVIARHAALALAWRELWRRSARRPGVTPREPVLEG